MAAPGAMRRLLVILFVAWALHPSAAGACGLSGPWYVSSDDGCTGIFVIETAIDDTSCEARRNVFSPLGDSAVEACRVLRSDHLAERWRGSVLPRLRRFIRDNAGRGAD